MLKKSQAHILDQEARTENETRRFKIAQWIFFSCIVINIICWLFYAASPELLIAGCVDQVNALNEISGVSCAVRYQRLSEVALSVFEFSKVWIPPLLGIVIGYYFTSNK